MAQLPLLTHPSKKVKLMIYKLETGGLVGIDTAYIGGRVAQLFSPYDFGVRLQQAPDDNSSNTDGALLE